MAALAFGAFERILSSDVWKSRLGLGELDAILRTGRPGETRHDGPEVEVDDVRVLGLRSPRDAKDSLRLAVRLDEHHLRLVAAGEAQVPQRLVVDGEDAAGRAVLRGHVRDRRAIGQGELGQPVAEELDELADDALLAKDLGDGEDEIGRRRPLGQAAGELHADDLRDEHRHRLPQHRGLGLDTADSPAENAEPVDHRRVRVGPDERVGIDGLAVLALHDDPGEVLEVHLMHDALVGRNDLEVAKTGLPPLEELVPLLVALILELRVDLHRVARAERVDLNRVVDDELDRLQGIDLLGLAAELLHRVAHRREVDDGRDSGEVLKEHARGRERNLPRRLGRHVDGRQRLDVLGVDRHAVLGSEQVLEQDLERKGQALRAGMLRVERAEPEVGIRSGADGEGRPGGEGVGHDGQEH